MCFKKRFSPRLQKEGSSSCFLRLNPPLSRGVGHVRVDGADTPDLLLQGYSKAK